MGRVVASDYLLRGPFGRWYTLQESLERRLQMEMWLAETTKGDIQKIHLERCQEYVNILEGKEVKKKRRKKV